MQNNNEITGYCFCLGHSHIDAAWLWPIKETLEVLQDTCQQVINLIKKYPQFRFCLSSAQYYDWLENHFPRIFKEIKTLIQKGNWEIVGGTWVEPDCNLPSGESLARQFLYGQKYFKSKFGITAKVGWFPDSFGFPWTMPQILKKAEIEYFLTQKMNWNDTTEFPFYLFTWESPDGSRILAHQTVGTYHEPGTKSSIHRQFTRLKRKQGFDHLLYLLGIGDHGGGVSEEMMQNILQFIPEKDGIKGRFAASLDFFNAVSQNQDLFPLVTDELYLQFHRGTYSTQAKTKKFNRQLENLIDTAERAWSINLLYHKSYPQTQIESIWKILLLNQFHDILPGSSIPIVYKEAESEYQETINQMNELIQKGINTLANEIDLTGRGTPIILFNPLNWKYRALVKIPNSKENHFHIVDSRGKSIPHQLINQKSEILFPVAFPSLGYTVYYLRDAKANECTTDLSISKNDNYYTLENHYYLLSVDKKTGHIISLKDKINSKEILRKPGNVVLLFNDTPVDKRKTIPYGMKAETFDAWEIFIYDQITTTPPISLNNPVEIRVTTNGPLKISLTVSYHFNQGSKTTKVNQEISLYNEDPLIYFKTQIDWHTSHTLAKISFPLTISSSHTTYEIPYGFISRRNVDSEDTSKPETAKYEVPAHKWIDQTDNEASYGVSLLNKSKYGFDARSGLLGMTLLRSPKYPIELRQNYGLEISQFDLNQYTDQGFHEIEYALYPHKDDFKKAKTLLKGYEYNTQKTPFQVSSTTGFLPQQFSYLSVKPENVVVTAFKKAEDSDAFILRLCELNGQATNLELEFNWSIKEIYEVNLLENRQSKPLPLRNSTLRVPIGSFEIKTFHISFDRVN